MTSAVKTRRGKQGSPDVGAKSDTQSVKVSPPPSSPAEADIESTTTAPKKAIFFLICESRK